MPVRDETTTDDERLAPVGGADTLVFLSHDSGDVAVAREIRLHLEGLGYCCWMAPDSVSGGRSWPEQIVGAIESCDAMLVLVSPHSNASIHVSKEVELAVGKGKKLLPIRLADVEPCGNLEYLLALAQWTDAFPGAIERHLPAIDHRIAEALAAAPPVPPQPAPSAVPSTRRRWLPAAIAIGAFVVGGLMLAFGLRDSADDDAGPTAAASSITTTIATTTSTPPTTNIAPAVAPVIERYGPEGPLDAAGCVSLSWSVTGAASVSLATPDGAVERVEGADQRVVCGSTGETALLSARSEDGSVSTAEYRFEIALAIESVVTEVRGRTLLFDVATNQAADVAVSLIGRGSRLTSAGTSVHHLEFIDQVSGSVEWQVVASHAATGDAVATGVTIVPYYSMRVSLVEGPTVVTPPATTTTTTTTTVKVTDATPQPTFAVIAPIDLRPTPIVIDPELLRRALGYWYTYAAGPDGAFLGRGCETTFSAPSVDEFIVPTGSDGSAHVILAIDWCPPDGTAAGSLPTEPDASQLVTLGPGFDGGSTETTITFPMNDMAVEITVLVERIVTVYPPDEG